MRSLTLLTVVAGLGLASLPAQADPALGVGITFWFGGGQTETGIGLRLFSDDENKSVVGSVGADYLLKSGGFRPTLGIAYLQDDAYIGADVGFDLNGGPLHFGAGIGATQTAEPPAAAPPPVAEEPDPERQV